MLQKLLSNGHENLSMKGYFIIIDEVIIRSVITKTTKVITKKGKCYYKILGYYTQRTNNNFSQF